MRLSPDLQKAAEDREEKRREMRKTLVNYVDSNKLVMRYWPEIRNQKLKAQNIVVDMKINKAMLRKEYLEEAERHRVIA